MVVGLIAMGAEEQVSPSKGLPIVEARMVPGEDKGWFIVEILSDKVLLQPKLQYILGDWETFYEPNKDNGKFTYRAKRWYSPTANTLVTLQTLSVDKKFELVTNFAIRQSHLDSQSPILLELSGRTTCEDVNRIAKKDPVLHMINKIRARFGLRALIHDPGCSEISRRNNYSGRAHGYMVGCCGQTWAGTTDAESAVNMWLNSGDHRDIILSPGLTYGGTHQGGSGTTFSGR